MRSRSSFLSSHRAVREALEGGKGARLFIAVRTPRAVELEALARENEVTVESVSRNRLRSYVPDARDLVLEIEAPSDAPNDLEHALASAEDDAVVLVLDHLEDPHNLGAILRSADQFGVSFVVVPERRSAPLSAVAIEASAGTAPFLSVQTVSNLAAAVESLKEAGFWIYAARMNGTKAHACNLTGRVCIVVGNEGSGVSRLLLDRADEHIAIPRVGRADSLNVSVAAGVLLYEVRRQQGWLDRIG